MQEATKLFCEPTQKSLTPNADTSEPFSSPIHQRDFAELMDLPGPQPYFQWWSLEIMFGIPESLFLLLRKTIRILRESERKNTSNTPIPSISKFQSILEDLEDEVLEWPIEQEINKLKAAPVSEGNRLIMQSYTRAFYQAVVVFFSRKARNLHRRYLQQYCLEVITHLEEIQEIKRIHNIRSGHMPWPAFVTGCQALHHELRARFLQWFDSISCEGILTSSLSKNALMEVWNQVETPVGLSDLSGLHLILT